MLMFKICLNTSAGLCIYQFCQWTRRYANFAPESATSGSIASQGPDGVLGNSGSSRPIKQPNPGAKDRGQSAKYQTQDQEKLATEELNLLAKLIGNDGRRISSAGVDQTFKLNLFDLDNDK